ncbi:hypothetical protein Tco_0598331 [Tanacetum coccineum]
MRWEKNHALDSAKLELNDTSMHLSKRRGLGVAPIRLFKDYWHVNVLEDSRDYGLHYDRHPAVNEDTVVSEQDELPSSAGLDFRARLDGGRMYSGHLEAMRLPWPA